MADVILFGRKYTAQAAHRLLVRGPSDGGISPDLFYLEFFWSSFPWSDCQTEQRERCAEKQRCVSGCLPYPRKLALLRSMASLNLLQKTKPERLKNIRAHFNAEFRDEQDERPCFLCKARFNHRHHIIQLHRGGRNRSRNIVLLCRGCHALVHAEKAEVLDSPIVR